MASRDDILTTAPTFCRLAERFTGPLHQVDLVHLYIINKLSLTPISLFVNHLAEFECFFAISYPS